MFLRSCKFVFWLLIPRVMDVFLHLCQWSQHSKSSVGVCVLNEQPPEMFQSHFVPRYDELTCGVGRITLGCAAQMSFYISEVQIRRYWNCTVLSVCESLHRGCDSVQKQLCLFLLLTFYRSAVWSDEGMTAWGLTTQKIDFFAGLQLEQVTENCITIYFTFWKERGCRCLNNSDSCTKCHRDDFLLSCCWYCVRSLYVGVYALFMSYWRCSNYELLTRK